MKKVLFLITFINLGICVNAQYLQKTIVKKLVVLL